MVSRFKEPYLNNLVIDPLSSAKGSNPILRSGDWNTLGQSIRSAQRIARATESRESISVSASASPLLVNPPMNLRTHLSRSNGYHELGMFDESI